MPDEGKEKMFQIYLHCIRKIWPKPTVVSPSRYGVHQVLTTMEYWTARVFFFLTSISIAECWTSLIVWHIWRHHLAVRRVCRFGENIDESEMRNIGRWLSTTIRRLVLNKDHCLIEKFKPNMRRLLAYLYWSYAREVVGYIYHNTNLRPCVHGVLSSSV
jgi:hypothetical protein